MTTYGVDGLSLWLPGRGMVVDQISAQFHGLTLVVGRSGSGASLLLNALAGRLPLGALMRGRILASPTEVTGAVLRVPRDVPDWPVHDLVGADPDHLFLAALGLSADDSVRAGSLSKPVRAGLALAWALGQPTARLVLADQPLVALRAAHRVPAVAALRRRVDAGTAVLWAEHYLEDALSAADTVVELVAGEALVSPAAEWSPRTLPLPPHLAAARALGLPRAQWGDPAGLAALPGAAAAMPRARRGHVGDVVARADGELSRAGVDLDLRQRETIGVVTADGDEERAIEVARRLVAIASGHRVLPRPVALPRRTSVDRVVRTWVRARRHPAVTAAGVIEASPLPLDLRRTTGQHSTGERAALRWALSASTATPRLLIHPEAGLDAAVRRQWATHLAERSEVVSVVVSRDPEFVARACHRVIVLGADGTPSTLVGTPSVVADRLEVAPVLRRSGLRVDRVRDLVSGPVSDGISDRAQVQR